MEQSTDIAELAAALAIAQGEIENASKNAANPHFRSRYADLAEVLNTTRPVLAKHGLSVVQFPSLDGDVAAVTTQISHKSGQWMRDKASAKVAKNDPQGVGSAITYLRRYSLAAVAGIAQEDDDANAASIPPAQPPRSGAIATPPAKKAAPAAPAPAQSPDHLANAIGAITASETMDGLKVAYNAALALTQDPIERNAILAAKDQRKAQLASK